MKIRQSTYKYTIIVQFTDLEKPLSHRKYANGGGCFSSETTPAPVQLVIKSLLPPWSVDTHIKPLNHFTVPFGLSALSSRMKNLPL
jgi:hypothetical protein